MTDRPLRNADSNHASPEEPSHKDRRTEIRNKARDIFFRYDYRKTTIEDIAKACGLGKAALYHYFSSKEEIFAEVVHTECANALLRVRAAVNAVDDPRAKLVAMVRTRFKIFGEVMSEFIDKELAKKLKEMLPLAASARQQFFEEEAKILQQILEEGQRRGVFKPMNLKSVPLIIISALRGVETHLAEVQDAPALDQGLNVLFGLFFEGICL